MCDSEPECTLPIFGVCVLFLPNTGIMAVVDVVFMISRTDCGDSSALMMRPGCVYVHVYVCVRARVRVCV